MSLRILIVEDEPIVAQRLSRLLGAALGAPAAALDTAVNLTAARERLAVSRYDALFLDLNLRGRDGFELLADAVAEAPQTVVVSANTDRALEAFGARARLESGATASGWQTCIEIPWIAEPGPEPVSPRHQRRFAQ